jgi:hypothetical protein
MGIKGDGGPNFDEAVFVRRPLFVRVTNKTRLRSDLCVQGLRSNPGGSRRGGQFLVPDPRVGRRKCPVGSLLHTAEKTALKAV